MTNLTEQWVKQTLPLGWYYIKLQDGSIEIQQYIGGFLFDVNNVVMEILAEVPSYEQWQAKLEENTKLKTENKWYSEQLNEAVKQNDKLKELLKECSELMDNTKVINIDVYMQRKKDVLNSINQVLGE